jgi:hypothetical protein
MLKECEEQAMQLPVEERAMLVEHLISSLDDLDAAENERMWVEEAAVRYEAYKRGEVESYPAKETIREIRDSLK